MSWWGSRWRGWVAGAAALGLAGCGDNTLPEQPGVQQNAGLVAFNGTNACADLENYLEDNAVLMMRTQLEAQRDQVPSWGWWGGWGGFEGDTFFGAPQAGAANEKGGAAPPAAPPKDYTTTNTQVAGVDEADFVKNDGTRIFVLSGNKLYATLSWPATQMALQGKLDIEGWPREMFLAENNQVVIFSSIWQSFPLTKDDGVVCKGLSCGYYSSNSVKVTVVDASDLGALKVTNEYFLPGNYNNSRRIGNSVRIVMNDDFHFPHALKWGPDWNQNLWNDKAALHKAYDEVIAQNEVLIRQTSLADWLPAGRMVKNGVSTVLPPDCSSFSKVNAPVRMGQLVIATLNLAKPDVITRTNILAETGEVYASADNLYVATRHWFWWPSPGQKDTTYFHKFDISQPDRAVYVASGKVDGHIVDQFSMDENSKGEFRTATTVTSRVPDTTNPDNWWGRTETTNRVNVMSTSGGRLQVIGQSDEIAKGESIQSSRFIDDAAYVVTFRQVDPLFTFDLSDGKNPRQVGELKVPGFSSYIHPLDKTHLLTIGTYIPPPDPNNTTNWQERRLQLSIFDVADLKNPKLTHTQHVGSAYTWSEAQYEHKAFNYFGAKKLLAIPFADYSWGYSGDSYWSAFVSDLRVFGVDPVTGFTAKGAVGMKDLYQWQNWYGWTYYWQPSVRRSVMADDFVYAISDAGLRVANIADLNSPVATVHFDRYVEE